MTSRTCIRSIDVGQLDALLMLCREHAEYEETVFAENGQRERWRAALFSPRPSLHCWLALDADYPCGFMTVTVDFATWAAERFAHMDCLFVRESYRGLGLGQAFIEVLQEFCVARNCKSAQWQTPPGNERGIAFYRSLGAEALPKLRFSYEIPVPEAPWEGNDVRRASRVTGDTRP